MCSAVPGMKNEGLKQNVIVAESALKVGQEFRVVIVHVGLKEGLGHGSALVPSKA